MPVRSLSSSVLKWPNKKSVDFAVRSWAEKISEERNDVQKIGYFGSYARGDWGVGSDLLHEGRARGHLAAHHPLRNP